MNDKASTQEQELYKAMALAFPEFASAPRGAENPHFRSKYADLGTVVEAIRPALGKHGLFFTQHTEPNESGVLLETVLRHASGGKLPLGKLFVPVDKHNAQGFGSALTYARRYALMTAFGVAPADDDGNAAVAAAEPLRKKPPISDGQQQCIIDLAGRANKPLADICTAYKVDSIGDLTVDAAAAVIRRLRELGSRPEKAPAKVREQA